VAIENLSGHGKQLGLGEWLLHQGHMRVEPALGGEDRPRVTGHEQHLDTRLDRPHLLRDFPAEHVRHDDVGDQQVDLAWPLGGDGEGLGPAGGGHHLVPVVGKDPLGHLAQCRLVLDDQDGFSLGRPVVRGGFGGGRGRLRGDRQGDGERRARSGL
jgi:hypothetical protein